MGSDPAILAQFSDVDGLEWFHLPIEQRRPFVLPDVGLIAVAEHPGPLEGRIRQARLFVGLCVWGRGQLEAEVERRGLGDRVFALRTGERWMLPDEPGTGPWVTDEKAPEPQKARKTASR